MSARIFSGLGPFRGSVVSGEIRRPRDLVACVMEAGLDGLEINPLSFELARASGIDLRIEDLAGIGLSLHSDFIDFNLASPNPYIRRAGIEQIRDELALAERNGIEVLTFHPGRVRKTDRSTALRLFWESLEAVVDHGRPVQLCLENMDHKDEKLCNREDEIETTLDRFPSLRLTVDLAHLGLRRMDIGAFLTRFGDSIAHVHVSGVIHGTPHSRVSLADSTVDLQPHIARLADRDRIFVIENGDRPTLDASLEVMRSVLG